MSTFIYRSNNIDLVNALNWITAENIMTEVTCTGPVKDPLK